MRKSITRQQQFTRRAFVFAGVKVAALSVLVGRLYYLQFIKSEEYRTLAEDNRIKLQLVIPARGLMVDRHGMPLARNQKNFRALIEPAKKDELKPVLAKLAGLLSIPPEEMEKIATTVPARLSAPATVIKEHLSWDEVARVQFEAPDLPGVVIDTGQSRYYPLGEIASHLLGYLGPVTEEELADDDDNAPLLRQPDFRVGKSGVEKLVEESVRGAAGIKQIEVNAHGNPVRELSTRPSTPGKTTHLTIDTRLQQYAAERLGQESGAIIVMDVNQGDVLALVSMPGFDPNIFSKGIPHAYWKELNENPKAPLLNKATAGQYPPGSTFKMMTGLAALKAGVTKAETRVFCPGHFMLGSHRFNCWKPEGHGSVNMAEAIAGSCDTYFYTMAQRTGMDPIAAMARSFGFGHVSKLGLMGERAGIVPDAEWKLRRYKQPWQGGDTVIAGIGQGYMIATPLQTTIMTARIANGGLAVSPRLLFAEEGDTPPAPSSMGIDPEHLALIQRGMNMVVNDNRGTAYGKRILEPEYAMAGKTGTAQVRRITVQGRDQSTLPWEERHHAWFVGYAPVDHPRYCCSILVEHGGGGASAAAPIARDVLRRAMQLLNEPVTDEDRQRAFTTTT